MKLPSGVRHWTVLDDDLAVVAEVDAYLRHVRFGRDHEVPRGRDRLAARVHQLEERDDLAAARAPNP